MLKIFIYNIDNMSIDYFGDFKWFSLVECLVFYLFELDEMCMNSLIFNSLIFCIFDDIFFLFEK